MAIDSFVAPVDRAALERAWKSGLMDYDGSEWTLTELGESMMRTVLRGWLDGEIELKIEERD